jgi:diketogulonate reductase-like aldo/keto reductase
MHYPVAFDFVGYDLKKADTIPRDQNGNLRFAKGVSVMETWQAMEALLETGKVRAIGICNFTMIPLLDILSYCKVTPAVLQNEMHPYYTRSELNQFAVSKGIHVEAYGSLGSGKADLLKDSKVKEIAKKYQKSESQVLLRWALEHKYTIIPKSSHANRLKENYELNFKLEKEEMKDLDNLNKNFIAVDTKEYWGFPIFV